VFVDSHCHLDRLKLDHYENGLDGAVAAAAENGVDTMLCVCISDENREAVVDISERYPRIFSSVGVHPCNVEASVVTEKTLASWVESSPKVVALGETGLDYYHSSEYVAQQQQSFINHLKVAGQLNLPVIVHTRNAREETNALIREPVSYTHLTLPTTLRVNLHLLVFTLQP